MTDTADEMKAFRYWVLEIQHGNPPMSSSDLQAFNQSAVAAASELAAGAELLRQALPEIAGVEAEYGERGGERLSVEICAFLEKHPDMGRSHD
jgi:hypothetical protein